MEEWKNGRMEEWKNGRMEEWKNGRMEEWKTETYRRDNRKILGGYLDHHSTVPQFQYSNVLSP